MSKNDITGDKLISKTNSKQYVDNYDLIWGKKDIPNVADDIAQHIKNYEVGHKQYTDEELFGNK
jgi:hypothetical protein